ncbi:MAG: Uncharacterized protein FD165_2190, partial [Gammaproteobacteria bacterium]
PATLTVSYTVADNYGGTGNITLAAASLVVPPPPVTLPVTENFSSGMGNWTIVNDSGTASSWAVVSGALRQENRVESVNAFDQSSHKGTYAYYTAGTSLSNYRFSTDAIFLGAGLADDIGIMFRYQNNNNYYRLSMNSRFGFTRLEKKTGGVFTPLAVNARGYNSGELLRFTIDLNGSSIQVTVNDDPLFAVNDSSLSTGTVALYTQDKASFDNVVIHIPENTATVTLATPLARDVIVDNAINATAISTNIPGGGGVEFLLDSVTSILDNAAPYSNTFSGLITGDHTVEAIVRDAGNVELARDTNTLVGVGGDSYIAAGDSITNGSGDNYATDNLSSRMLGFQGYETNLSVLLEGNQGKPVIVYNEGIGGDESVDTAFNRIGSILARHSNSNKALVMLGTNDALALVPSGSGCTGTACNGTYKGNMQSLINTMTAAGKTVYTALPPPVFGSGGPIPFADPATATLNTNYISAYNSVVLSELTGRQLGPDLYSYFLGAGQNRFSLFSDVWHPNALGYTAIAALWYNTLNPATPAALPFVLDSLVPSTTTPYVKQNLLETGDTYYVDAAYILTAIPAALNNGRWIMAANGDTGNTSASYINFSTDRPVTVYIAYDGGAAALPGWMSTFTSTGLTLSTTDPFSPTLNLYSQSFSAGPVTLGGNSAAGSSGADSHYVVIVVAN